MTQYIDKSAVVAEIDKKLDKYSKSNSFNYGAVKDLEYLRSFLNTLEEKGEDFEPMDSDFERDAVSFCLDNGLNTTPYIAKTIAKHFYKLGQINARKEIEL